MHHSRLMNLFVGTVYTGRGTGDATTIATADRIFTDVNRDEKREEAIR